MRNEQIQIIENNKDLNNDNQYSNKKYEMIFEDFKNIE